MATTAAPANPRKWHARSMKEGLKTIGNFAIWIAVMVGVALVAMLLIRGGVWLSGKLYPWLISLSAIAIAVSVFILVKTQRPGTARPAAGLQQQRHWP
jgi:hypothetical protein